VVEPLDLFAFEINAAWHCNLACVACSHASPVTQSAFADPETARKDLANLASVVTIKELRVVGGEPLLHPQLGTLLQAVRDSNIGGKLCITTNGTRLHLVDLSWLPLVDLVYVSRYPRVSVRQRGLDSLCALARRYGTEVVVKDYDTFRQVRSSVPLDAGQTQAVFDTCQVAHKWSCHTVHEGHVYLCPVVLSPGGPTPERCRIEPTGNLRERLRQFLERRTPLRACSTCLGTVGNMIPHRQANAKTWNAATGGGFIDHERLELVRRNDWIDHGCSVNTTLARPLDG
jgi:organic radical activating enzyme